MIFQLAGKFMNFLTRNRSPEQYAERFASSGKALETRYAALSGTDRNRQVLNHIIGIERWGQSRLRVALGAALIIDEYNHYRPARERTWQELLQDFKTTRQETLTLIEDLQKADLSATVLHNQYGQLTPSSWLYYLNLHATMESKKMR